MSKTSLARRLFLGRAAMAPAFVAGLPAVGGTGTAYGAAILARGENKCGAEIATGYPLRSDPLMERLYKALNEVENNHHARIRARDHRRAIMGGFDPDIAALISVPAATKLRMQTDREARERETERGWHERARKALGLPT